MSKKKYWEGEVEVEEKDTTESPKEPVADPKEVDPENPDNNPWPAPATPEAVLANDLLNMLKARTDNQSVEVQYAIRKLCDTVQVLQALPAQEPPPPPPPPASPAEEPVE